MSTIRAEVWTSSSSPGKMFLVLFTIENKMLAWWECDLDAWEELDEKAREALKRK